MQSDFTVFREHLAEACRDRKKTPDPLCGAVMEEFFRLKAKEGNSGLAFFRICTIVRIPRNVYSASAAACCVT